MNEAKLELLRKVNRKNLWDDEPVFCFSTDIDWASEDVLENFFGALPLKEIKLTTFVTHESAKISALYASGQIDRGIHPNFLPKSSHGDTFEEIIETCVGFAPESFGFRSHRLFDVTDITHLLHDQHGYKYVSNLGTIMGDRIRPLLHESGLAHFPIFFEDGSHLYNDLGLSLEPYLDYFTSPGIKIVSFHPMNMVFNTPYIKFMREIKDSLSREEFNNIDTSVIAKTRNNKLGIRDVIFDIFELVRRKGFRVMSMNELYQTSVA